jgi:hypothetical protein
MSNKIKPPPVPPRPRFVKTKRSPKPLIPDKPQMEILPRKRGNLKIPGLIGCPTVSMTLEQRNQRYILQLEVMSKALDLIRKRKLRSFGDLITLLKYEQEINELHKQLATEKFPNFEITFGKIKTEEPLRIAECCATCKFFIYQKYCWFNKPNPSRKRNINNRKKFINDNYPKTHAWATCNSYLYNGKRLRSINNVSNDI